MPGRRTIGEKRSIEFMSLQERSRIYHRFKVEHITFSQSIQGSAAGVERYTSLLFNRLMFVYFLQYKGLLDNDLHYLTNRLRITQERQGPETFYRSFIPRFFYEGLSKQECSYLTRPLPGSSPSSINMSGAWMSFHGLQRTRSSPMYWVTCSSSTSSKGRQERTIPVRISAAILL